MSANSFNSIVILDAIPDGEANTARRLQEELQDIACYVVPGLHISYIRIKTMADLENAMFGLLQNNRKAGQQPLLHLEGHGLTDESGFVLADGTPCSWIKLKKLITPLNRAMELNLLLVLATCFGGSFATAITTTDRAPVWGMIGPTEEITAGEVERSFTVLYKTFFDSFSAAASLKALNASAPRVTYFITVAEQFFYAAWKGYKKEMCSEEEIEKRATRMRNKAIYDKALSCSPMDIPSIETFKRLLRDKKSEKYLFEKYRDTFFMIDLYPTHQKRFSVTYEEAEKFAAN